MLERPSQCPELSCNFVRKNGEKFQFADGKGTTNDKAHVSDFYFAKLAFHFTFTLYSCIFDAHCLLCKDFSLETLMFSEGMWGAGMLWWTLWCLMTQPVVRTVIEQHSKKTPAQNVPETLGTKSRKIKDVNSEKVTVCVHLINACVRVCAWTVVVICLHVWDYNLFLGVGPWWGESGCLADWRSDIMRWRVSERLWPPAAAWILFWCAERPTVLIFPLFVTYKKAESNFSQVDSSRWNNATKPRWRPFFFSLASSSAINNGHYLRSMNHFLIKDVLLKIIKVVKANVISSSDY